MKFIASLPNEKDKGGFWGKLLGRKNPLLSPLPLPHAEQ